MRREPFLVLEYLAGGTLGHLIAERRKGGGATQERGVNRRRSAFELPHFIDGRKNYFPWAQALGWARDMALALRYMHDHASTTYMYICRDLKPDNIGFTADGVLKIFDFGLAKRVRRKEGTGQRYIMTNRTGTVRYMAPESFLGMQYNEKVDVYAWSHVIAEMLSLDLAYEDMTTAEFRMSVAMGSLRPHVERRWPKSIQKLLKRCWAVNSDSRPGFDEILSTGVLEQAAGPHHSWFSFGHHSSTTTEWRSPTAQTAAGATSTIQAMAGTTAKTTPATVRRAPQSRQSWDVRTLDRQQLERPNLLDLETIRRVNSNGVHGGLNDYGRNGALDSSLSEPQSPAFVRFGPLHLPACFFGRPRSTRQSSRDTPSDEANVDEGCEDAPAIPAAAEQIIEDQEGSAASDSTWVEGNRTNVAAAY